MILKWEIPLDFYFGPTYFMVNTLGISLKLKASKSE